MVREKRRKICIAALLSCCLTLMQTAGWQISMKYGTSVHTSALAQRIGRLPASWIIPAGIAEFAALCAILYFAFHLLDRIKTPTETVILKSGVWVTTALLLFLCWVPVLLACFPGFYNYDIVGQLPQVMYEEVPYSTHHPLLHTLLAGGIITLGYHIAGGDLTMGVFLHSIVQMGVCAGFFACFIRWIYMTAKVRWLAAAAFLYYAFSPPIALFTMSTTKDVVCAVLLQMSVILLYEAYRDGDAFWLSRKKVLLLFAVPVLACLFRNNVVYAVILLFLCVLCGMGRDQRILILSAAVVFACFICQNGLRIMLGAQKGSMAEACSVPFQQIARVYVQEGEGAFSAEELRQIDAVISRETLLTYDPFSADNIKNFTDYSVISENKGEYLGLWAKKGLQYPHIYLTSFLENTYQAWYPGTSIICDPSDEETYYFDFQCRNPVSIQSKIPWLYDFYYKISFGYTYQKYPAARLFFSIGAMFWAALIILFYGIWARKKAVIMAQLFILLVCLTVFLGPVTLVRYYLLLFYALPVSAAFLADRTAGSL